jgi:C4-type Zn-finger protein
MGIPCPEGGDHEWEITDYTDDTPGGGCVVMRGPVCRKCNAIGEYVLPGGWQEALTMTTAEIQNKVDDLEIRNEFSDIPSPEARKQLNEAQEHIDDANRLSREG